MIADAPPSAPAHDPRAQECVELQIVAELAGWKVGQRVNVIKPRGQLMVGVIRSFTCDGTYRQMAIVQMRPPGWIEAVPLSELRAVPALVDAVAPVSPGPLLPGHSTWCRCDGCIEAMDRRADRIIAARAAARIAA